LLQILLDSLARHFIMQSQGPSDSPEPTEDYPVSVRVRRSLARRFPRTRIAYNWTIARARHFVAAIVSRTRRFITTFGWLGGLGAQLFRLRREKGLTVGVDVASLWEPLTGVGWYLYLLLQELADADDLRIRLFPPTVVASDDLPDAVVPLPEGPAIRVVRLEVPPDRVVCAGATIRFLRRIEPLLRAIIGSRVLFAPNFYLPKKFALNRAPQVATVHDLGSVQVPWTLSDDTFEALSSRLQRSLASATRLITVSESVRAELLADGYPYPDRVQAIHHGPGLLSTIEPGPLPNHIPARFALHVGTLEPRKNIDTLIEAWSILFDTIVDAPALILCGKFGWKSDEIRSKIEDAESQGRVVHLGYVADRELAALYHEACMVILPSLYEGFGLPAVEAQFAGTPLICSDIPVLHEVAADGALFVPVDRPDLFAAAARDLLTDDQTRQDLIRRGTRAVSRLSWTQTAARTAAIWRAAADEGSRQVAGKPS